jgi:formylglycine-generating enzyme required for sulfatase activity
VLHNRARLFSGKRYIIWDRMSSDDRGWPYKLEGDTLQLQGGKINDGRYGLTEMKGTIWERVNRNSFIAAMMFVRVPKGTFWMSKDGKNAQVQKTIGADFELAAYTVTQEQWQAVMGNNVSYFSRQGQGKDLVQNISDAELKQFPVESVAWSDVQFFCRG